MFYVFLHPGNRLVDGLYWAWYLPVQGRCVYDLLLDDTTDVANFPEFADRRTTKIVDGSSTTGFFVDDFSYAELQMLRDWPADLPFSMDYSLSHRSQRSCMYIYESLIYIIDIVDHVWKLFKRDWPGPLHRAATPRPTGRWASMLNSSTQIISMHKVISKNCTIPKLAYIHIESS